LHPDGFDIVAEFEYNCTPRLRREVRQIIFQHFDQLVVAWRQQFGADLCRVKRSPFLAKAIKTTPHALVLIMETKSVSIPWERCSERLASATWIELNRAELSPTGYGIHWPLIDEDFAVGPLLFGAA